MYKQVVFNNLSPISDDICHSKSRHIKSSASGIAETQHTAFIDRYFKCPVGISRNELCREDQFIICIDHQQIVVHIPALSDITGSEGNIVKLISHVKCRTR